MKDCYAALGIIHQTWSPVPGRIKDFIAMPRPNGYQSLHTSVISEQGVPFEVQIRTEEMHRRAEEGIAAHWKYKEGRVGDQRDERYFQWMRQLLEVAAGGAGSAGVHAEPEDRPLPGGGLHLHAEGRGDRLPRGATPVDFAYGIHTDVGNQCVGARDQRAAWCRCARGCRTATSSRSLTQAGAQAEPRLARLRRHLARPQQDQARAAGRGTPRSIELGRRLFEKEARRFDQNPKTLLEGEEIVKFASEYGAPKVEELLAPRRLRQARRPLGADSRSCPADCCRKGPIRRWCRRSSACCARQQRRHKIKVRGVDDLMVVRALLQPDPGRAHRRLHHARQRRVGALRERARTSQR